MPDVVFEKAQILCYRIFDIAEEVFLDRAQALLAQDSRRLKLTRAGSEYLQLPNPPLSIGLARRSLPVRTGAVSVDVTARVFDHGAASVILRVPVTQGTTLEQLIPLADELYDSAAVEQIASDVIAQLRQTTGRYDQAIYIVAVVMLCSVVLPLLVRRPARPGMRFEPEAGTRAGTRTRA